MLRARPLSSAASNALRRQGSASSSGDVEDDTNSRRRRSSSDGGGGLGHTPGVQEHSLRVGLLCSLAATLLLVFLGLQQHLHLDGMDTLLFRAKKCHMCKYQAVYGNHTLIPFTPNGTCGQQLMVLGLHNSGTSMVARLLTLAGLWAGRPDQLSIGKHNKLKWWERHDVYQLNDRLASNHTNPSHPAWIGAGFDPKLVLPRERANFKQVASAIVQDMNQYCPWMIKDPRMCFLGTMWMELMSAPVCTIVYRHPARIALRLGMHRAKGTSAQLNPDAWLAVWETMMTAALKTCRNRPTVIVQSVLARPETLDVFYDVLLDRLEEAGLEGLVRPPPEVLEEHFVRHYRPKHSLLETAGGGQWQGGGADDGERGDGEELTVTDASGTGALDMLSERCSYQEVSPMLFNSSMQGIHNYLDMVQAWPHDCSIKAPDSTRTLVMAFEKVLAMQYTGAWHVPPRMLAQSVLKMQDDLLYDMELQQAGAAAGADGIAVRGTTFGGAGALGGAGRPVGRGAAGRAEAKATKKGKQHHAVGSMW